MSKNTIILISIAALLVLGVFWGVGGAILNVYKAYKKNVESLNELKDDVRYKHYNQKDINEDHH